MQDELDDFKQINLSFFSASYGFKLIKNESSKNCLVMKGDFDKLIITRQVNGHFIYFNVNDSDDNGTIIDFIQKRTGLNIGQIRKLLREYLNRPLIIPAFYEIMPINHDTSEVIKAWNLAKSCEFYPYLTERRLIKKSVVSLFSDTVKLDKRNNTLFAHHDKNGLCGFEIKNNCFTGFYGAKGLWCKRLDQNWAIGKRRIEGILFFEGTIDALSYFQLYEAFIDFNALFVSFAGSWSERQAQIIQNLLEKQKQALVIIATDSDEAGERYAQKIVKLAAPNQVIERHKPDKKDWNEVLKAKFS